MYNITNASNISFTTVYNAESDFTIYCKIYNGSLNIFSNTVKYHSTNMCRVASCRQIHIAYMHNDILDANSYSYFSNKRR